MSIRLKKNIIMWLEFELAYYDVEVQDISHYTIRVKSKVDDLSWGWLEGSLFNSYHTEM